MKTTLILASQRATLLTHGREAATLNAAGECPDHPPVVKLFTPDAACTWLLSELDPDDPDRAFGLCDLGVGFPELGWVDLRELSALRGKLGLPVERDRHFTAAYPMSVYVRAAERARHITEQHEALEEAARHLAEEQADSLAAE